MQVLSTILYILLFLLFLSVLIVVHELGHLAAAKAFKVYCLEYSVGMGPAIFKKKRKNGETQFSIRAIPFGGYVSMYGEGVELPEGVEIPESRSLNGIKWWKRAIIMIAGVTMNAILALVFFFIANCFPQETVYVRYMNVEADSIAYASGLRDGDRYKLGDAIKITDISGDEKTFYVLDYQTTLNGNDEDKYVTCVNLDSLTLKKRDMSDSLYVYEQKADGSPNFSKYIDPSTYVSVQVNFSIVNQQLEDDVVDHVVTVSIPTKDGKLSSFGSSFFYEKKNLNFGQIVKKTFVDYGENSVLLIKGIGGLFNPANWKKGVGGIIAVGFETTSVLKEYGFVYFLRAWGLISVNLAIFNLLPFPGLDGWQLLVTIVEATTRKKIPEKVKNAVSFVGIALLFLLMGVIVVKDLITYVFMAVAL